MSTDLTPGYDEQGQMANDPSQAGQLQEQGYYKCLNPMCDFHFSPERMSSHDAMDTLDCPNCQRSYNMLDSAPFAQAGGGNDSSYSAGGGTIAGISMKDQGEIGEDIVRSLGEIPGYGSITWWHEGGAQAASPLDGGTADWGVEVKTLNVDAKNHRWIPGGARRSRAAIPLGITRDEKDDKNRAAEQMGYKGVLGVLVILDYRRSVADIYVREMPLGETPCHTRSLRVAKAQRHTPSQGSALRQSLPSAQLTRPRSK
jgi:hypothetical protein